MQSSIGQYNVSAIGAIQEQRDDADEHKSVGGDFVTRDQTGGPSANSSHLAAASNSIQQIQMAMREHWSKRLRGSGTSPTDEGYACENDTENNVKNAMVTVPTIINQLKQLQVPKVFAECNSALSNDLVGEQSSNQSSIGGLPRKQILTMIQSKSDMIANETQRSWNILVEKAEASRSVLAERPEVGKITAKLAPMFNRSTEITDCYREASHKSHVREVSFDYQLMSDVDYSSAPCTSVLKQ
jgi:hypothetical protein